VSARRRRRRARAARAGRGQRPEMARLGRDRWLLMRARTSMQHRHFRAQCRL